MGEPCMTAFAIGAEDSNLSIQAVADAMETKGRLISPTYILVSTFLFAKQRYVLAHCSETEDTHKCCQKTNISGLCHI